MVGPDPPTSSAADAPNMSVVDARARRARRQCTCLTRASAGLRVSLQTAEVEYHARLIAHYPGVVPGRHVEGVAGTELALGPVVHSERHAALEHIADVLHLAGVLSLIHI